jgi:hypothetical protein
MGSGDSVAGGVLVTAWLVVGSYRLFSPNPLSNLFEESTKNLAPTTCG